MGRLGWALHRPLVKWFKPWEGDKAHLEAQVKSWVRIHKQFCWTYATLEGIYFGCVTWPKDGVTENLPSEVDNLLTEDLFTGVWKRLQYFTQLQEGAQEVSLPITVTLCFPISLLIIPWIFGDKRIIVLTINLSQCFNIKQTVAPELTYKLVCTLYLWK